MPRRQGPVDVDVAPALLVQDVAFTVAHRTILSAVDIALYAGQSLALMGRSGAGKSCLLSIIIGLQTPTHGTVRISGQLINGATQKRLNDIRRQRVGVIFQHGELLPDLTPLENVIIGGLIAGMNGAESRERATETLRQVEVPTDVKRTSDLSGGEQQRVAVARALLRRPALLVADEPTASLDTETRDQVMNLLYALPRSANCAMIVATHDRVVADMATTTYRLPDR